MASPIPTPPGFDALPVDEQIEFVMDLWDRIGADASQVPVRASHVELVTARIEDHRAHPDEGEDAFAFLERVRQGGHSAPTIYCHRLLAGPQSPGV